MQVWGLFGAQICYNVILPVLDEHILFVYTRNCEYLLYCRRNVFDQLETHRLTRNCSHTGAGRCRGMLGQTAVGIATLLMSESYTQLTAALLLQKLSIVLSPLLNYLTIAREQKNQCLLLQDECSKRIAAIFHASKKSHSVMQITHVSACAYSSRGKGKVHFIIYTLGKLDMKT